MLFTGQARCLDTVPLGIMTRADNDHDQDHDHDHDPFSPITSQPKVRTPRALGDAAAYYV